MQLRRLPLIVVVSLSLNLPWLCVLTGPVAADEGADWKAMQDVDKQAGPLTKTDPAAAIEQYRKLYESRAGWSPVVANLLTDKIAGLYRDGLKNPAKAHEIYDWGLDKFKTDPARIILLEGKAATLLSENRAPEAESLLLAQWPQLVMAAAERHPHIVIYTSRTLHQYSAALERQEKQAEVAALLHKALREMPVFLDARRQLGRDWSKGWMYEKLVASLLAVKRPEEALQWAKLNYMLCAFDKAAVERAGGLLGQVWGQLDDLAAMRAFAVAQADASNPNPLSKVPLPEVAGPALTSRVARLRGAGSQTVARDQALELITLLLATGAYGDAMTVARRFFLERRKYAGYLKLAI